MGRVVQPRRPVPPTQHLNMVHQVADKADFTVKLAEAGGKLVVVDFFATWCGPCVHIAPVLEEMSKEMGDVVFLKVDVDKCEELSEEYKVEAMPTFILIKGGVKVADMRGANEEKLRALVAANK